MDFYNYITPTFKIKRDAPQAAKNDYFKYLAKKTHGDLYDYSRANFLSRAEKITILCTEHGEFDIPAGCHLDGNGCKYCKKGSNKEKPDTAPIDNTRCVYLWQILGTDVYKLGVAKRVRVFKRVHEVAYAHQINPKILVIKPTKYAYRHEKILKRKLRHLRSTTVKSADGFTEMYTLSTEVLETTINYIRGITC